MASYAIQTASAGGTCIIASSDKDVQQVVTENILIYSTLKHDLPAPDATFGLLGPEAVERKWGVPPALLGDLLSLTGDSSDNIPGVPGVGPKGAAALLTKYGSLDAVLTLPPDLPEKMRLKLSEHGEAVRRNREMVRLDLDLPLPLPPEALIPTPDATRIRELAEAAGLRSLAAEFGAPASPKPEPTPKRAKKSPPPAVTPSPDSPLQGELF
jgi:DNA polymerase-1